MMRERLVITLFLTAATALCGEGVIAPVSGVNGEAGHRDGTGAAAIFNDPMGLARDATGNVFLCDARNHVIRKISPAGVVTTLAGEPGTAGAADGLRGAARFRFPADIAIAPGGDLYVADSGNHCIRKVKADGTVSTLAGNLGSANDITTDYGAGYTLVARQLDGTGAAARFSAPAGIAYAPGGFLYVSDTGNHIIRRVDLNGAVTTLAGKPGAWGAADGTGAAALFNTPMGMCVGVDGNLYIADSENHTIRRMTPQAVVSTYSGSASEHGCKEGSRLDARYSNPVDISPHPDGGFIICESFGNSLFRMDAGGMVSVFSGGAGSTPRPNTLSNPSSAVCDPLGNVFVADTFNQEVRLVVAKFEMAISKIGAEKQITLTWDSLPGRDYQLQILGENGWQNAPRVPVRATAQVSNMSFPMPANPNGIYRILLLGFQ
jgi:sugar lactone lactonase YvrE